MMRKKLKLSIISGLSCLWVLGFVQPGNAQVCTPGQTIERDVAPNQARTGDGSLFEDGAPLIRFCKVIAEYLNILHTNKFSNLTRNED